ncbi:bifunctional 2-polyprenyl-6-hydroxyphenol methylase/3-demethylubiquinol 3-O-methyltransferase UbiG [Methylibium sp.]|uniref:class I SAM-dependent methyltransferase n=1 Tax=Methylibium sp. TaxID=2067992 RepID=UPI0025F02A0E|nr:class I SAM-dependent methyltransferase [Methylibium sp.]
MTPAHAGLAPSPWVRRWAALLPPHANVLDVACGTGRHVRWLASLGHRVTGIDRDAAALEPLRALGETIVADIEAGAWPLPDRQFDAVVVTNYLWRARLPDIVASVAPGGLLIYETFAVGNESVGKPSNPDFLLRPGELLSVVQESAAGDWRVLGFEDGFLDAPPRFVQRIAAVREHPSTTTPARYPL